jgi:phosphohistidine phosphatase
VRCYFLRHGAATEPEDFEGSDFDRPLTDAGRERMTRAAKALSALDLKLDAVVTSPLLRAKQTAAIVAKALHLERRLIEDTRLGGGFGPGRLGEILRDHRDARALLLVGHEPGMSDTVGHLVRAAGIAFKKGTIACVELPEPSSSSGELLWLLPAKILAAFAPSR